MGIFTAEDRERFKVIDRIATAVVRGELRQVEQKDDYRETLAALCHEQWSGWITYMLGKCEQVGDGLLIPQGYVDALRYLAGTPYADLDEDQKGNDRREADRFLALR